MTAPSLLPEPPATDAPWGVAPVPPRDRRQALLQLGFAYGLTFVVVAALAALL